VLDLASDRAEVKHAPWAWNPCSLESLWDMLHEVGLRCVGIVESLVVRECELAQDKRNELMLRLDVAEAEELCREMGFGSAAAQAHRALTAVGHGFHSFSNEAAHKSPG
jgi:hypothetical protein